MALVFHVGYQAVQKLLPPTRSARANGEEMAFCDEEEAVVMLINLRLCLDLVDSTIG